MNRWNIWDVYLTLYDTIMVDTGYYTFVNTLKVYKDEP